jgi:hypothetical protein
VANTSVPREASIRRRLALKVTGKTVKKMAHQEHQQQPTLAEAQDGKA